jgi:hypothetical protein
VSTVTRSDVDYVEDPHSAARLYLEAKHQAAHAKRTGQTGLFTESKATMNRVSDTWPEAPDLAATASDQDLGGLSPELRRTRDEHRQARGHTSQSARNARRRGSGSKKQPAKPTAKQPAGGGSQRTSRFPSAASGRALRRAAGSAGDWATLPATEGYGRMAFEALGWGVGLSMLYLLLTNAETAPKGRSAVELVTRGVSNTIATLVSPLADPLSPNLRPAHH